MFYLHTLRGLADSQEFEELKNTADRFWQETGDVRILPLLALAHAQLGERSAAVQTYEQAVLRQSELDDDACADLAGAACLLLKIDEAIELLEPLLEKQQKHSLALARLAWCRMQLGNHEEARALYRQSAEINPGRIPVWISLARLSLELNDIPTAQHALDSAIEQLKLSQTDISSIAVDLAKSQLLEVQLEIWIASDQVGLAEEWLEQRKASIAEPDWAHLVCGFVFSLAGRGMHALAEEVLRDALKSYPENLTFIGQLIELVELQGRSGQLVSLIRRAIRLSEKLEKPQVGWWVKLAHANLRHNEAQARKAVEKSRILVDELRASDKLPEVAIRQMKLQVKNLQAQLESEAKHFTEAEAQFREILDEDPYFLPALQGLGYQQMQLGKIDEAIALFEQIKLIDPIQGYSSLINVRQFPEDEQTLVRIEKAVRRPGLGGPIRSGLMYQLASAWEKRKEFDKAFSLAREANEANKPLLPYDAKVHRQRCARIRYAFNRSLFDHRKAYGYSGERESLPIFVLGMPRSGTTLVEQIIASHTKIFGAGELGIIPQRIAGLGRWERHVGSGRTYPDCVDDLSPSVTAGIAKGILEELHDLTMADKPEAEFVVDKLPHNFENIGLIKFLFPKAKIISVRRDPRDIALSNYFTDYQAKHSGMGFAYDMEWIGQQLADHNLLMHHWNQVFPGEILEVNYEDVVENTDFQARRMLNYIGVDFEPQVLSFNKLDRPVKTASVWQVRQPIYKTSKAKWTRHQNHLADLIKGANAKIEWDEIKDMVSLPEPGLLQEGVELYNADKLDEAEYAFKKLLHHLPEHAAANHMVGIICARKGHISEAIELMEKALNTCPWNNNWRKDLIQACEIAGDEEKAERARTAQVDRRRSSSGADQDGELEIDMPADEAFEPAFYLTEYSR